MYQAKLFILDCKNAEIHTAGTTFGEVDLAIRPIGKRNRTIQLTINETEMLINRLRLVVADLRDNCPDA